jgi:hypothetical protein
MQSISPVTLGVPPERSLNPGSDRRPGGFIQNLKASRMGGAVTRFVGGIVGRGLTVIAQEVVVAAFGDRPEGKEPDGLCEIGSGSGTDPDDSEKIRTLGQSCGCGKLAECIIQ